MKEMGEEKTREEKKEQQKSNKKKIKNEKRQKMTRKRNEKMKNQERKQKNYSFNFFSFLFRIQVTLPTQVEEKISRIVDLRNTFLLLQKILQGNNTQKAKKIRLWKTFLKGEFQEVLQNLENLFLKLLEKF